MYRHHYVTSYSFRCDLTRSNLLFYFNYINNATCFSRCNGLLVAHILETSLTVALFPFGVEGNAQHLAQKQYKKMSKPSSIKVTRNNLQKRDLLEQNIKTLNQLAQRPNITIKKKVVLKNYGNTQKNINNPRNKVTNSLNKVTNSLNKVTNSLNKVTNSQNQVTKLQKHIEKEKTNNKFSKNMVLNRKVGLMEKLLLMKNVEYYPDHRKRNIHPKKIKLQPKHDYKVVATTNKRKRRIPHRGVNSIQTSVFESPCQDPPSLRVSPKEQLSLSSLVQLAEEQGLDDEDFMEILTCPSPVWWEDNSDEDDITFDEDFDGETTKVLQNTHEIYKKSTYANANKIPIDNELKRDIKFFKKFVTKRSKLESVLGNIKCKKIPEIIHITNRQVNDIEDANNSDEFTIDNECTNRTRKYSLGLSDISINEDELINTFESIEIPVKEINYDKNDKNELTNDIIMMEIRNKPIENNEMTLKHVNKSNRRRTRKIIKLNNNELKLHATKYTLTDNDELKNEDLEIVPTDLPPLTKNPFKNTPKAYESPKSLESVNSETTSVIELDSISDTNIKFLDEYVDSKGSTDAGSVNRYGKSLDGELVTVYQILSNKVDSMDVDIEQQIKANLVNKSPQTKPDFIKNNSEINSFFKTRKSAYRRSK